MSKILITGDTFLGSPKVEKLAEELKTIELFGDFAPIIKKADLAITNLESPVTDKSTERISKTGPHIKSSVKSLDVLKNVGFNMVTLANNHILDFGFQGLKSTINACNKLGLDYTGAGTSFQDARKPYIVKNFNNSSVCIINIAENEFSTTQVFGYGAHPFDLINNSYEIIDAKKKYDIVIVIVHGGREHYPLPSPKFQKALRFFVENGADAVIAHHSHCYSGYEIYKDSPIFYSLGNFHFNNIVDKSRFPLWNSGIAVELEVTTSKKLLFRILPYHQCKGDKLSIELLKNQDLNSFYKDIEQKRVIIENKELLFSEWTKYIDFEKRHYITSLFVRNKWLKKLVNRKLIPLHYFYNKTYRINLINLIRCEAHEEILMDSLKRSDKI
ncbi:MULTISPECIES: CapA family protein [Maribacter]|uniref:Poly-gamma-glutamate synthesis protein (Capsule biosynthesis protein) n=1 Tax=Maribacter dokdonensis TaxID=320912 RepID=A0A1H4QDZ7_9FLAO|nr:CapA family protein [Maribacter dokdonensis]SEC17856.1 poly-gamma-glutamate synthesis protein (capsule biosynthesis protein) [Maribacter dokdonensis]